MCEPVTLTMMGLSMAQSSAKIIGQRSRAKTQFGANAEQREKQNEQIADQASVKAGERVKQARAEQARLRVAAGEAGITGQSFEAVLMDSVMQEDMDLGLIGREARLADEASETRFLSANAAVQNPSLFESGLQIAGAAASGYALGQSLLIPTSSLAGIGKETANLGKLAKSGTIIDAPLNLPIGPLSA